MTKNHIGPLDQWVSLNRILHLYKIIGVTLGVTCLVLTVLSFYLATNPPVVVVDDGRQRVFHYSEKRGVELSEIDIAAFITNYVKLRYAWEELDPVVILQNISPLTTKGLLKRIKRQIKRESGKRKSSKKIKQTVANIKPTVTPSQSLASFDRIVRIDNIPLLAPAQVSFRIVRGVSTKWNPMGLYVDGITMHEVQ